VIFDKGRGIGGRLATRRTPDSLTFDHGAQYLTARSTGFRSLIEQTCAVGAAGLWDDGSGREHFVGNPGMNAIAKHLGDGLDIRLRAEVHGVSASGNGWSVSVGTQTHLFRHLIITVPAPQARRLLGPAHPFVAELDRVRIMPCLTLMAAFAPDQPKPFYVRSGAEEAIAWIAQNSTKPGRPEPTCWVAQAGSDWSNAHLERDLDEIAGLMLPMLCDRLGADQSAVRHAAAHRWRYARTTVPLGQSFLRDDEGTLYLGGDWCLGARAEAAWSSGTAIAEDLLKVAD
jgi:predicted NAD/FAD-dependent oxidoreductase